MLVMQFADNFDNMVFGRYNDFKDVADIIYSFRRLNDTQARKWVNSYLRAQELWSPNKLHMITGPKFRVWGVPEDPIKVQSTRVRLAREEIIRRILLYYSDEKLPITQLRFVIQKSGPWTVEIEVHPDRKVQFWVAYSLKDSTVRTTQVDILYGRCNQDFPIIKTVQDYIVQVHKQLMLNQLLAGQKLS